MLSPQRETESQIQKVLDYAVFCNTKRPLNVEVIDCDADDEPVVVPSSAPASKRVKVSSDDNKEHVMIHYLRNEGDMSQESYTYLIPTTELTAINSKILDILSEINGWNITDICENEKKVKKAQEKYDFVTLLLHSTNKTDSSESKSDDESNSDEDEDECDYDYVSMSTALGISNIENHKGSLSKYIIKNETLNTLQPRVGYFFYLQCLLD